MTATEGDQKCCGAPVDRYGFCQYRDHHQRQVTPELLANAFADFMSAEGSEADKIEAVVRGVVHR